MQVFYFQFPFLDYQVHIYNEECYQNDSQVEDLQKAEPSFPMVHERILGET